MADLEDGPLVSVSPGLGDMQGEFMEVWGPTGGQGVLQGPTGGQGVLQGPTGGQGVLQGQLVPLGQTGNGLGGPGPGRSPRGPGRSPRGPGRSPRGPGLRPSQAQPLAGVRGEQ